MRAVVLRSGRLEVRETADPVPREGEPLIRTISTAICASDVHYMDNPQPVGTPGVFAWDADRDVVMGHEFVGDVVALGPGCAGNLPGRYARHRAAYTHLRWRQAGHRSASGRNRQFWRAVRDHRSDRSRGPGRHRSRLGGLE